MRLNRSFYFLFCALLSLLFAPAGAAIASDQQPLLRPLAFVQPTMSELGRSFPTTRATRAAVLVDRKVYQADEMHGQAFVLFLGHVDESNMGDREIALSLVDASGDELAAVKIGEVQSPKLPVLFASHELKPGRYEIRASLLSKSGEVLQQASATFVKSADVSPKSPIPADGIPLIVHAQQHAPDESWPITTGLAMPRMTVKDPQAELMLHENGKPVAAHFSTRATWTPDGYAKWIGVDFEAKYDDGKPREYRIIRKAADATPHFAINVNETDSHITVSTGVATFDFRKQGFNGLDKASIHTKLDTRTRAHLRIISDEGQNLGGSYIVDNQGVRYSSALDSESEVVVETQNAMRTTVRATGWYRSDKGEPLCKYVIRITAFAGKPYLHMSHRVINTIADRWDDTRLTDAGFSLPLAQGQIEVRMGVDGEVFTSSATSEDGHVFLHQDRSDHLRIVEDGKMVREGKRSDGWVTAGNKRGAATVFVQDFFQKYPKEFEYITQNGQAQLVTHFWPDHGGDTYTDGEELARDQIYKVRFAHEGDALELKIPDKYHKQLEAFHESEGWAGGAELVIVDSKNNLSKMQVSSGQGTVIGNDMFIMLGDYAPSHDQVAAITKLMQDSPHALPDPKWTCATGVLGPIAPRDPERFGPAEALLDSAYAFYQRAIIDGGDAYGMWTYGGVHSNWDPQIDAPSLVRVWQMSHYQNVFQAWMLYARSGLPVHHQWARIHSNQHMDVGVCNYLAYPKGKHSYAHIGDIGGNIYHCKGFMPWAGNASTQGHWIDISNYYLRYYLTGDQRGLDMGSRWMQTIMKMGNSNEANIPDDCTGWQSTETRAKASAYLKEHPQLAKDDYPQWIKDEFAKPRPFNPREEFVPLGEMVWYYEATWDPHALIELDRLSQYLDTPFYCSSSPELSHFGKHWQDWYFGLTRDERVIERITEFMTSAEQVDSDPQFYNFNAFLFNATGDSKWIEPHVRDIYDDTLNVYRNPGDRYHEYSIAHSNPGAMLFGRLPNVLYAIDKAGLKFDRNPEDGTAVPFRSGRVDTADKWLVPPRGWSNTSFTVLGYMQQPGRLDVVVDGPRQFGSFRGLYMLFNDWPTLISGDQQSAAANLVVKPKVQQEQIVLFEAPNRFNDPPTQRNVGVSRPPNQQHFPYVERAENDPNESFYRLEYGGDPVRIPLLFNADANAPIHQVAVVPRTVRWNNQVKPASFRTKGVVYAYMQPVSRKSVVTLSLTASHNRYSMPTTLKLFDADGRVIIDTSVMPTAARESVSVKLDPAEHPLPWLFISASSGDSRFEYEGADELLFAGSRQDLHEVLPRLIHARTTASNN